MVLDPERFQLSNASDFHRDNLVVWNEQAAKLKH